MRSGIASASAVSCVFFAASYAHPFEQSSAPYTVALAVIDTLSLKPSPQAYTGLPFACASAAPSVLSGLSLLPTFASSPRELETNRPQASAIASTFSLGMQPGDRP